MVGQIRIESHFKEIDQMKWHFGKTWIKAESNRSRKGEIDEFTIRLVDEDNYLLYDDTLTIDWDMGGGGFLKAMQADDDTNLEIVCVKKGRQENFYLDIKDSKVLLKDFATASPEAIELSEQWLKYYAPNPFSLGFWFLLTFIYYILYFPLFWLLKKIRRKK